jgi:hypothetical protein
METINSNASAFDGARKCGTFLRAADPISEIQFEVNSGHERNLIMKTESENFFSEPVDPQKEGLAVATHVICRLLVWMADGRTLEARGLRTCVALFCIRPDLIDDETLEHIGTLAGCSRQAVHKLAVEFRETTGLQA